MPEFSFIAALIPALALPFLLRNQRDAWLSVSSILPFADIRPSLRAWSRGPVRVALASIMVVTLAIAAAGPYEDQLISEPEDRRNIMLALDVSGSMRAHDIPGASQRASRMDAVKYVVEEFIERRVLDRIGLVVFGSGAYLQSPLTVDRDLLLSFVKGLVAGMAGEGTAIGDGLGVSIKHIANLPGVSRAVILVTDGVNNSGSANPIEAATVAKELGIKVHVVGVGGGGRGEAEYDEATLKQIATLTGGVFFNAHSIEELENVYAEIDRLETSEVEDEQYARESFSFIPLLVASLAFFMLHALSRTYYLTVP